MTASRSLALGMCVLALGLWAAIAWFANSLWTQQQAIASRIAGMQQATLERTDAGTAATIAAGTESGRASLRDVFSRDVVSLAGFMRDAGNAAGVNITVANVSPGPAPAVRRGSALHPARLIFATRSEGTFSQLMHAAALLESLPAASRITELQLTQAADASSSWTLNANIDIITGAAISL